MQLRNSIAYTHALNVLKVERNNAKEVESRVFEDEVKQVPYNPPAFLKNSLKYSKVYDGNILEQNVKSKEDEYKEDDNVVEQIIARKAPQKTIIEEEQENANQENVEQEFIIDKDGNKIPKRKDNQETEGQTKMEANNATDKNQEHAKIENKDKKKAKTKNKQKENKIEQLTKAKLYKNRNKILSKMPLSEALYKRLMSKHLKS